MPGYQFDEVHPYLNGMTINAVGAGSNGQINTNTSQDARVDALIFSWNGAADISVNIVVDDGNFDLVSIGNVAVPAGAGSGTVPAVEAWHALGFTNLPSVILPKTGALHFTFDSGADVTSVLSLMLFGGTL